MTFCWIAAYRSDGRMAWPTGAADGVSGWLGGNTLTLGSLQSLSNGAERTDEHIRGPRRFDLLGLIE
jgi:hypothetical protein